LSRRNFNEGGSLGEGGLNLELFQIVHAPILAQFGKTKKPTVGF